MSSSVSREVNSLPLSRSTIDTLLKCGFRNVVDLKDIQPLDLASELKCTPSTALEIFQTVQSSFSSSTNDINNVSSIKTTAKDLFEKSSARRPIITFSRMMDNIIGGGVPIGQITEFCGVPGVGKTQLAIQLALNVQIPEIFNGNGGEAIYLDTEGSFMVERAAEMANELSNHLKKLCKRSGIERESLVSQLSAAENMSMERFLEGIHIFRAHDQTEQIAITNQFASFLKLKTKIKLIIIDSIAFHFRQDMYDTGSKSRMLSTIAQTLNQIAFDYNVAIVVINHVTTRSHEKSGTGFGTSTLIPALGEQWSHCITNRIMLHWRQGKQRIASLMKCPCMPPSEAEFIINAKGIRDVPTSSKRIIAVPESFDQQSSRMTEPSKQETLKDTWLAMDDNDESKDIMDVSIPAIVDENSVAKPATTKQLFSNVAGVDYIFVPIGTIGAIISGLSLPFMNVLMGKMLDSLSSSGSDGFTSKTNQLCTAFAVAGAINIFSGFAQVFCWTYTGERQTQKFRERYVRAILSQEIGWFDKCGAAELATKVSDNCGKVQNGLGRKFSDLIQLTAQFIGSFGVGFYLCWQLTVVLLAAFPFIVLCAAYMINAITNATTKSLEQYSAAGGLATESLNAIRTVTSLNLQPVVISRYRVYLFEAMQAGIKKGFDVGLGNGALFFACFLTYALGFWYGSDLLANSIDSGCTGDRCLTGGSVLATFFSILMGSMALGQLAPPAIAFTEAKAALGQMLSIIDRKPLIDGLSEEGKTPSTRLQGQIQLDGVKFAYPSRPNIYVCKNYTLQIKAGETVALVGASGCGKSTIINLLLRFYDPQVGSVRLDGMDIRELNIRWLRSQIGFVGQEPVLFAGTIGDNIAYGLDSEDTQSSNETNAKNLQERIIAAAKLANAHNFISEFPQGYDTDVGSNGIAMSGGQKQRIAIARALIKKPAVLLLDEATSALDATSETVVQQSIDALQRMKSQTTIVIAHRLSTIRNADRIFFIQEGEIKEIGSHDELMMKNGLYADLVKLQMDETSASNSTNVQANKVVSTETTTSVKASTKAISVKDMPEKVKNPISKNIDLLESGEVMTVAEGEGDASKTVTAEESKKLRKEIWARVYKHWGWLCIAIIGGIGFGSVFPFWGLILAHSQNTLFLGNTSEMRSQATMVAYYYMILAGVAFFFSILEFWGTAQVGERVSCRIRSELFESLLRREISFFDREENSIGTLTTALSDDSRTINKAFGDTLARLIQAFFTIVVGVVIAMTASWQMALVVLATFPLNIAASIVQVSAMVQHHEEESEKTIAIELATNHGLAKEAIQDHNSTPENQPAFPRSLTSSSVTTAAVAAGAIAFVRVDSTTSDSGATQLYNNSTNRVDPTPKAVLVNNSSANNESNGTGIVSGNPSAVISTAFTNMRTVCAFSMQRKVAQHYAIMTSARSINRRRKSPQAGIAFGFGQATQFFIYGLLFWYGSRLESDGQIDFEQMMTAIFSLMLGALGLGIALGDLGDQQEGLLIARRVFKTIEDGHNSPIDGLSKSGIKAVNRASGKIDLIDVCFRYPSRPDIEVCKDFNILIKPGEMIALVGPSGSGKSTIVSLQLRFYDPVSGLVTLDNENIRELNVRWLRSQIGYVGQEPVLFSGTVAENVMNGRAEMINTPLLSLEDAMKKSDLDYEKRAKQKTVPKKTSSVKSPMGESLMNNQYLRDESVRLSHGIQLDLKNVDLEASVNNLNVDPDVIEACKASYAHEFIMSFPQGYHTQVGEGSIMVSGGQKQRIAIARALIKKPAVLLLDEATSALDAASEAIVQQSIDALQKNKSQSTIVVAHRLSTVRNADRIIVVNAGKIVEVGTHDELIAIPDGLYTELWLKQNSSKAP